MTNPEDIEQPTAKRILLIANPVAGGDARPRIKTAQDILQAGGATVELILTARRGDAERAAAAARRQPYNRVVAAGGDGTLNEVINGLVPSSIPLAFLPLGTANVCAWEAGLPQDLAGCCQTALAGVPTPVALGSAGERRFLLMAGIGLDGALVRWVDNRSGLKRRFGRMTYLLAGLAVLCRPLPPLLRLFPDQQEPVQACWAVLSNGRYYAGPYRLAPDARLVDSHFELLLLTRRSRLALLRLCWQVLRGRRPTGAALRQLRVRQLRCEDAASPVQLDGDYLGETPLTFQITTGELQLMLPRSAHQGDSQ